MITVNELSEPSIGFAQFLLFLAAKNVVSFITTFHKCVFIENKRCLPGSKKSAKKGSVGYLMFGPNHIFVALSWDDGRFHGHNNVCR